MGEGGLGRRARRRATSSRLPGDEAPPAARPASERGGGGERGDSAREKTVLHQQECRESAPRRVPQRLEGAHKGCAHSSTGRLGSPGPPVWIRDPVWTRDQSLLM